MECVFAPIAAGDMNSRVWPSCDSGLDTRCKVRMLAVPFRTPPFCSCTPRRRSQQLRDLSCIARGKPWTTGKHGLMRGQPTNSANRLHEPSTETPWWPSPRPTPLSPLDTRTAGAKTARSPRTSDGSAAMSATNQAKGHGRFPPCGWRGFHAQRTTRVPTRACSTCSTWIGSAQRA